MVATSCSSSAHHTQAPRPRRWERRAGAHFGSMLRVVGARVELVQACNHPLDDGDVFTLEPRNVTGLLTPCHTASRMCFLIESKAATSACIVHWRHFCWGGGRFFEGNAEQMQHNPARPCLTPAPVGYFVGVTPWTAWFASWLEPSNKRIRRSCVGLRPSDSKGKSTMPSTVEEELKINPFMRCTRDEVASAVQHAWSIFSPHDSAPLNTATPRNQPYSLRTNYASFARTQDNNAQAEAAEEVSMRKGKSKLNLLERCRWPQWCQRQR